jgi:hypothetical protein
MMNMEGAHFMEGIGRNLLISLLGCALALSLPHSASAHPADQSEMRVRPGPHQLEIRFTFNILTLTRFVGIDTDGDAKISMEEFNAAQPRIASYLNRQVRIEINRKKATLGSAVRFEALWPDAAQTPPMSEPEYAARNVDVTFVQTFADKLLEDFWLGFEIFEQTGPMQTIRGVYEQDGRVEEVPFSVQDPEYLYDTGYADDPFLKEAEKKAAKSPKASVAAAPWTDEPLPPAVVAPAIELPPPPALVTTLGGAPAATEAAAPNDKHWWMIRAVVLMILLVVGRKLQLSARSRLVSTRRRPRPR